MKASVFGASNSLLHSYAVELGLVENDLLERVIGNGANRNLAAVDHQDRGLGDVDVFGEFDRGLDFLVGGGG